MHASDRGDGVGVEYFSGPQWRSLPWCFSLLLLLLVLDDDPSFPLPRFLFHGGAVHWSHALLSSSSTNEGARDDPRWYTHAVPQARVTRVTVSF